MEPTLRSAHVLKQEAEDLGSEGKEILEQQALDREERAAWRDVQKMQKQAYGKGQKQRKTSISRLQANEKKRADEIRLAQIGIEKELKIKEMELQAQQAEATTSSATTPPPRNKGAKSPKLPSFIDEKDELDSYILRFECFAENTSWEKDT